MKSASPEKTRERRIVAEAEAAMRRYERSLEPKAERDPEGSPDPPDAISERDFEIDYEARPEDISPYEEDI